jgi:hypothetical protein
MSQRISFVSPSGNILCEAIRTEIFVDKGIVIDNKVNIRRQSIRAMK